MQAKAIGEATAAAIGIVVDDLSDVGERDEEIAERSDTLVEQQVVGGDGDLTLAGDVSTKYHLFWRAGELGDLALEGLDRLGIGHVEELVECHLDTRWRHDGTAWPLVARHAPHALC